MQQKAVRKFNTGCNHVLVRGRIPCWLSSNIFRSVPFCFVSRFITCNDRFFSHLTLQPLFAMVSVKQLVFPIVIFATLLVTVQGKLNSLQGNWISKLNHYEVVFLAYWGGWCKIRSDWSHCKARHCSFGTQRNTFVFIHLWTSADIPHQLGTHLWWYRFWCHGCKCDLSPTGIHWSCLPIQGIFWLVCVSCIHCLSTYTLLTSLCCWEILYVRSSTHQLANKGLTHSRLSKPPLVCMHGSCFDKWITEIILNVSINKMHEKKTRLFKERNWN